jgi:aromatic ring-cleaving dioxygenase
MTGYHAHIYFTAESRPEAEALLARIAGAGFRLQYLGRLIDRPIGPHPLPMFEIDFGVAEEPAVLAFLQQHRGSLSVLVHEVTGKDLRDHTEGARWLGKKLELDFSALDP